jgi:hypothetical protein
VVRPAGWRGLVEKVGDATARLWARMGRASGGLEADLAVRGKTSGTFYGERVAGGVLLLLWVPVMRILGVHIPLAPVWSLVLGAVGFFLPARLVKARAAAGHQELSDGVAEVAVLMSLAVSAGVGVDAAFRAALSGAPGRFATLEVVILAPVVLAVVLVMSQAPGLSEPRAISTPSPVNRPGPRWRLLRQPPATSLARWAKTRPSATAWTPLASNWRPTQTSPEGVPTSSSHATASRSRRCQARSRSWPTGPSR